MKESLEDRERRLKIEIKGLRGSTKKWVRISIGTGVDVGGINCPLCLEFYSCKRSLSLEKLSPCPVYALSDNYYKCENTPYGEFRDAANFKAPFNLPIPNYSGKLKTLANKELMFLQSILESKIKELKKETK